jgi:hypothetical protein
MALSAIYKIEPISHHCDANLSKIWHSGHFAAAIGVALSDDKNSEENLYNYP